MHGAHDETTVQEEPTNTSNRHEQQKQSDKRKSERKPWRVEAKMGLNDAHETRQDLQDIPKSHPDMMTGPGVPVSFLDARSHSPRTGCCCRETVRLEVFVCVLWFYVFCLPFVVAGFGNGGSTRDGHRISTSGQGNVAGMATSKVNDGSVGGVAP